MAGAAILRQVSANLLAQPGTGRVEQNEFGLCPGRAAGLAAQKVECAGTDNAVCLAREVMLQIVSRESCGFYRGYVFKVERPRKQPGAGIEIPGQAARSLSPSLFSTASRSNSGSRKRLTWKKPPRLTW